jgi:hypothetical protein
MHRKILMLAAIGAALCQPAAAVEPAPPTDAIPGKVAPDADAPKTDLSNGVIHPEGGLDPKMQKPAPAAGAMQVIPPPDGPGAEPK